MLKTSWALDQVISQWSFSSQPLTDFACFWKWEYSHFPTWLCSTTLVSILPVQLFPMVELAVCADCLWFQCTLLFCYGFVLNFLSSLLSLGYGNMPVWTVVSLVALCLQLSSEVLGKLHSAFLESTIYRSDFFFITYCFELTIPNQSCLLELKHKQSQNFCWWG